MLSIIVGAKLVAALCCFAGAVSAVIGSLVIRYDFRCVPTEQEVSDLWRQAYLEKDRATHELFKRRAFEAEDDRRSGERPDLTGPVFVAAGALLLAVAICKSAL
ncbi:MAG: hypothetical protein KGI69_03485 [Patescibacteria group bacterium]|nr:hypothetical protein [Patescibacteria group bacterium]